MSDLEISRGPTDEESAAIAAVVAHVLTEEAEVAAAPPARPRQSDWVLAWRPQIPRLGAKPETPRAGAEPDGDE